MKGRRRNTRKDMQKTAQVVTRCSLIQSIKFEHESCGQFKTKPNPQTTSFGESGRTCKHCQYSY